MSRPTCQTCKHARLSELMCRPTGGAIPVWKSALRTGTTEFPLHTWDWWQADLCDAYEPEAPAPQPPRARARVEP